jgi:hypothetical protein
MEARMMSEVGIGKHMGGGGRGLIYGTVLFWHSYGLTEDKCEIPVCGQRFEPRVSQIRSGSGAPSAVTWKEDVM